MKRNKNRQSLATKLAVYAAALVTITMLAIALLVRQGVVTQFKTQYDADVQLTLQRMERSLLETQTVLHDRLVRLANTIRNDPEFRFQVVLKKNLIQPFVVDYASRHLATLDMQVLAITTADGVVISSGNDRNAFGNRIGNVIRALKNNQERPSVVMFETTGATLPCIGMSYAFNIGQEKFHLVAGKRLDPLFLQTMARDNSQIVLLKLPRKVISSRPVEHATLLERAQNDDELTAWEESIAPAYSVGKHGLPVLANENEKATLLLLQSKSELQALLSTLNRRMILVTAIALLLALVLSFALGRSVTQPLQRLASAAESLSLERLDTTFDIRSKDEVGVLNDALDSMTQRLKLSRLKLASAEKKAAFADIARQVNHDIKNGFIPIRNVMQHLQEVAAQEADGLLRVFNERKSTILESLGYLENLARKYSQLRPENRPQKIDVNCLLRNLLKQYEALPNTRVDIRLRGDEHSHWVDADSLQLRRAFENIIQNAMDALNGSGGLTVSATQSALGVQISFEDTGGGIPDTVQKSLFQPHMTTKENGTGLGLVSVKRIIEEAGGTVMIESDPGVGTTVHVTLPEAEMDTAVDERTNECQTS